MDHRPNMLTADEPGKLTPNSTRAAAVVTTDSRSQQDGSKCLKTESDIESTTSELPCGGAQETLVRGQAVGGRTTVDVKVLKREDRSLQTTVMLITVSTSYVLAYLPVLFHFAVSFILLKLHRSLDERDARSTLIAGNYTKLLYVGGVAVNFFLYTVSGRVFRTELIKLLSCRRKTHSAVPGATRSRAAAEL